MNNDWKLVPTKVTNEMIDAANAVPSGIAGSPPHWQWIWDAMLDASPAAPAQSGETKDWRVGLFRSSSNPRKQVRVLADGYAQISEHEKHHSFVRWIDDAAPQPAQTAQSEAAALQACRAIVKWCDKNPPAGDALWCVQLARQAIAGQPAQTERALTDERIKDVVDAIDFGSMVTADDFIYVIARAIEQASRRAALEEAATICDDHASSAIDYIASEYAISIRALANGDANGSDQASAIYRPVPQ